MQSEGTFLGLTHDFSVVSQTYCVNFWARQRLHDKIQQLIDTARTSERLPKGVASKIYGIANFLEQGIFGRVGYGGLMAIKARQDEDVTCLAPAILQCFEVIEAVMKEKPFRPFPVSIFQGLRFLAASDAAEEADKPGSGGFHLIFFDHDGSQNRHSFVAGNCQQLQRMWAPGQTQHDPRPVCLAHPGLLGVRAKQEQLGGCRLGIQDPWRKSHGFSLGFSSLPLVVFQLPFLALILVFEYH